VGSRLEHESSERASSHGGVVVSRRYSIAGVRVGRFIAVVHDGRVVKGRVLRGGGSVRVHYRITGVPFFSSKLLVSEEGITWARDWTGSRADALRTVVALR
jgi:hypothetical protein